MDDVHDLAWRIARLKQARGDVRQRLSKWRMVEGGPKQVRTRYCQQQGWLIELDDGHPPVRTVKLPGLSADDLLEVQLAELELLNDQTPPFRAGIPETGDTQDAIFIDSAKSCWAVWWPCKHCSGFSLDLPVSVIHHRFDPSSTAARFALEMARSHARALKYRLSYEGECPGCMSAEMRNSVVTSEEPLVWLDVSPDSQGWQVWIPFAGGISMPLEMPPWADPEDVDREASALALRSQGGGMQAPFDWEEEGDFDL